MSFKYKDEIFNSLSLIRELVKDYNACPECGSKGIGSNTKLGSMDYNGKLGTFERTCRCGWKVKIKVEKI
ncbi:DUF3797 domain-containing protein [Rummeliibacillus pycnus]|uniref:DUF3797 domain-containing protein n=1 Tax=Rummeliibacillus pycnus TaxID=101070 RepID=UPI001B80B729|nr:DUF3797 domain-containing protein [Rummeliibacillus pycnus]